MNDLIERDALLLKQKAHADLFAYSTVHDDIVRRDEATAALAEIINAPTVNRWISVKDALPDGSRAVLVQYNEMYADGIHKQYAVAFYGKYTHHWIEPCSGQNLNVTKWQELDIQNEKE